MSGKDSRTPQLSDNLVGLQLPTQHSFPHKPRTKAIREAQPLTQCEGTEHTWSQDTTSLWDERQGQAHSSAER